MELINPWVLYITIPLILLMVIVVFIRFKSKDKYKDGKKVGNSDYITETKYYKMMKIRYRILKYLIFTVLIAAIAVATMIYARPVRKEVLNPEINNRDIFLCMDISDSVDELNLEICDELEDLVRGLEGERFGISIFNGRSVLLVPLTTDYEYVISTLKDLKKAFQYSSDIADGDWFSIISNIDYETYYYKYEGTLCDYGSSFIGDGLASCLYSFPDLKEDTSRTRLIIFSTDNELNGEPTVTVDQATELCAKNNVKVFALSPRNVVDEDNFKDAILSTGGSYHKSTERKAVDKLIGEIKATKDSVMYEQEVIYIDQPQAMFIVLLILVSLFIILSRRIKL